MAYTSEILECSIPDSYGYADAAKDQDICYPFFEAINQDREMTVAEFLSFPQEQVDAFLRLCVFAERERSKHD